MSSDTPAFFGSLRSEFDTVDELPAPYAVLRSAVVTAVGAYQNGAVSADRCAAALSSMVITDTDGIDWTVGASSQRWYRRLPGGQWRLASPASSPLPDEADTVAQQARKTANDMVAEAQSEQVAPSTSGGSGNAETYSGEEPTISPLSQRRDPDSFF